MNQSTFQGHSRPLRSSCIYFAFFFLMDFWRESVWLLNVIRSSQWRHPPTAAGEKIPKCIPKAMWTLNVGFSHQCNRVLLNQISKKPYKANKCLKTIKSFRKEVFLARNKLITVYYDVASPNCVVYKPVRCKYIHNSFLWSTINGSAQITMFNYKFAIFYLNSFTSSKTLGHQSLCKFSCSRVATQRLSKPFTKKYILDNTKAQMFFMHESEQSYEKEF